MTKENKINLKTIQISPKAYKILTEASEELGMTMKALHIFLLTRALNDIKNKAVAAKGFGNLGFGLVEMNGKE